MDQWREVEDRKKGKGMLLQSTHRESAWYLPDDAILIYRKRKADKKEDHLPSSSDDKENKENLPPATTSTSSPDPPTPESAGVIPQRGLLDLLSVSNLCNWFDQDRRLQFHYH